MFKTTIWAVIFGQWAHQGRSYSLPSAHLGAKNSGKPSYHFEKNPSWILPVNVNPNHQLSHHDKCCVTLATPLKKNARLRPPGALWRINGCTLDWLPGNLVTTIFGIWNTWLGSEPLSHCPIFSSYPKTRHFGVPVHWDAKPNLHPQNENITN